MANVLNIENLTKAMATVLLFGGVTFGVDEGDKIGVVARKEQHRQSTMLRIIAPAKKSPDSGNIVFRNGIPGRRYLIRNHTYFRKASHPYRLPPEAVPFPTIQPEWGRDVRISQVLSQLGLHSYTTLP